MPVLYILLVFLYIYIEAILLFKMMSFIGVFFTLVFIILSCVCGLAIVKQQNISNVFKIRERLSAGDDASPEMGKSILLMFAGLCFILPGFISTVVGALLLIPFIQTGIIRRIQLHSTTIINTSYYEKSDPNQIDVIEGEFTHKDREK